MESLKIWCNADLSPEGTTLLKEGVAGHSLTLASERASNLSSASQAEEIGAPDIIFGQPDPTQAEATTSLKWIHITSAGYTRYDTPDFRQKMSDHKVAFTNSSSVYDEPCAQHLLAFMLASARQLPAARVNQSEGKWAFDALRPRARVLRGDHVLIVGYGAIGRRLADLLQPFNVEIFALRRRPRGDEPIPTFAIEELDKRLPATDHIVNILPANEETNHLFGKNQFDKAKPGAIFYNIGRGTTVDQPALISALESGQLGGALLDVTDPEPLPSNHPLWKAPNCAISPHIGGGLANEHVELVKHFLGNLRKFEAGQPLVDRVF